MIDFDTFIPVAVLTYILSLVFLKKRYNKNRLYLGFYTVFYVYMCYVIKYTQFPIQTSDYMRTIIGQNVFQNSNFIPLLNLTKYDLRPSILNIIVTIPFGFGIGFLTKISLRKLLILSFSLSFLLELTQLMVALIVGFTLRSVDINDIIFNTSGALIGYSLFKLFHICFKAIIDKYDIEFNALLEYIYRSDVALEKKTR